jgi:predicted DNA-binding protein (MmcQ/YjbR family)
VKQEAFDALCLGLPAATYVNQWGGSHVYKVGAPDGGKVFAIAPNWNARNGGQAYIFKVSEMAFELLIEHGLAHPAPYLGRSSWVQLNAVDSLDDDDLAAYIRQAHGLIAARLTRAARRALNLA